MKLAGYLISIAGFIAFIYSLITYINNSESFSAFGLDVAVSQGNPVPMIISAVVLVAGVLITRAAKE